MSFSYNFPAVKGLQAGREYYIAMIPLKLLSRLFPADNEYVLPEYRAQRVLNETRIPEIKRYILENRNTYVFSALSASIDGNYSFTPTIVDDVGILEIDMNSVFLINDGQHRKAAIEAAMKEDRSLENETISIVFFGDNGLARSQQMFTDLNKHAVKTSNSLSTLYDTRDEIAIATKNVIDSIDFFEAYTDKERDSLGKNSSKLFTLNNLYVAIKKIIHGSKCNEDDMAFLLKYWKLVSENIVEWNELLDHSLTKRSLREDYIVTFATTLYALGKLGRFFYDAPSLNMDTYLKKMSTIDWRRTNTLWINRTIQPNVKVMTGDDANTLTCSAIKSLLGIALSNEELSKEKQFTEKYRGISGKI